MASKLGNWFHGEREKLRELTAKEKVQYIWSYYYLWIIGISAFLAISIFLTVRITTSSSVTAEIIQRWKKIS